MRGQSVQPAMGSGGRWGRRAYARPPDRWRDNSAVFLESASCSARESSRVMAVEMLWVWWARYEMCFVDLRYLVL